LFVRPVIRMDQTTWCACHVEAFEFFNGYAGVDTEVRAATA
jgi:transposase